MNKRFALLLATLATYVLIPAAFAAPDLTKLIQKSEVESALGCSVDEPTVKELPAPLGGSQITFTGKSLPIKTYALSLRTDATVAAPLKASGMTAAKMYQQSKTMWTSTAAKLEPVIVKGGEGFSSGNTTAILKNGMYLSATTLFGGSKAAAAARTALTVKAADRL